MQTAIFNGHYDLAARLVENGRGRQRRLAYTAIEMRNLATYSNRAESARDKTDELEQPRRHQAAAGARAPIRTAPTREDSAARQAQGDIVVTPERDVALFRATRATGPDHGRACCSSKGANPSRGASMDGSTPLDAWRPACGARRIGDEEFVEKAARADLRSTPPEMLTVEASADVNTAT